MFRWLFGISYIKSMFPFYPPYGLAKESRCQVLRSCKRWLGVFFWQQVNKNITPKRGRRRKSTSFPTKWVFPKIGGTPKWMVYGTPYQNGWFGGTPICGKTQMTRFQGSQQGEGGNPHQARLSMILFRGADFFTFAKKSLGKRIQSPWIGMCRVPCGEFLTFYVSCDPKPYVFFQGFFVWGCTT